MRFLRIIKHVKILPRWVIFFLDLTTSIIAFTIAYYLYQDTKNISFSPNDFATAFLICTAATSISFTVFKLYTGIVRYTSSTDSIRILSCNLMTVIILFGVKLFLLAFRLPNIIDSSLIVMYSLLLFMGLVIYRTTIKIFFQYSRTAKKIKKNAGINIIH